MISILRMNKFLCNLRSLRRPLSTKQSSLVVLGIESSCDDTAAAVVDGSSRCVLGEAINSQIRTHTLFGGIKPVRARDLHEKHIHEVVTEAMSQAGLNYSDLDAIATTVQPGLVASLLVGCQHGKLLALQYNRPFIPVHHMEAHTLTVRMLEEVPFPFLCLLVSGGHCLLVRCNDIDSYQLLGQSIDDAPGEALDKGARTLNLRSLSSMLDLSGGAAIETLAKGGDPHGYKINQRAPPLSRYRDCNFSFSGIKSSLETIVIRLEKEHGLDGDTALPPAILQDLCASYQHAVLQHVVRRTHRAMLYTGATSGRDEHTLVVSGGVASNTLLRQWLTLTCERLGGWKLVCPPARLCTDNGIMVAWNGVERLQAGRGVLTEAADIEGVTVQHRCPLGEDISNRVAEFGIKIEKYVKVPAAMDVSVGVAQHVNSTGEAAS